MVGDIKASINHNLYKLQLTSVW